MKTKLIVEIKTKDFYKVWEDYEKEEKDYTKEELKEWRDKYAKGLHKQVVNYLQQHFKEDIQDLILEDIEEYSIENWDDWEDYGITIKVTKEKIKK